MAKIFICASVKFPREDPGANRIQYVAKALMHQGYEVVILSCGRTDGVPDEGGFCTYDGIPYRNISSGRGKLGKLLRAKVTAGRAVLSLLRACHPTAEDRIFLYGSNSFFIAPLARYARRRGIRAYIDVVEWHQPFQYKFGRVDPRYRSAKRTFERLAPRIGNVSAISERIAEYYRARGCNVGIFPVFVDTDPQSVSVGTEGRDEIHLIYPGNPATKDNVRTMLEAMHALSPEQRKRCVFHMTGVTAERIRGLLGEGSFLVDALGECLVFHGWMEYEELVALYRGMDFLYMPRLDNPVSQANFPSKLPELMAWGIAPICNRVGDYHHYLTDGRDAIVFARDDAAECAAALERALAQTSEERAEMKRNARKCAVDRFDYRVWEKKLIEFMEL